MQWKTAVWSLQFIPTYQLSCKSGKQWEIFKRDQVTPLLRDLKWINFHSILWLNEASFMYKNLYVSADSNVKKINYNLQNKVSQGITRNGSDVHIDYRRTAGDKKLSQYRAQSYRIRSQWISEIQIPLLCSKVKCTNISEHQ